MKPSTKKVTLFLMLAIGVLVIETLLIKPIMFWVILMQNSNGEHYSGNGSYPGWDVNFYTHSAEAIIIGKVTNVNDPYVPEDILKVEQEGQIQAEEVLKGDSNMEVVTVTDLVGLVDLPADREDISLEGIVGILKPEEKVLIFLGKSPEGKYVPLAGPYSKFVIDANNYAIRVVGFNMPLNDLKAQIKEALKLPPKEHIVTPVEKMI